MILIEGPLAHASIKSQLRQATRLLDFIKVLIAPISAAHIVAVSTTAGLVARGGAICAERQQKGQITYYDFLPMLEINVLHGGEHTFAALIDKNDRVEGGKTYSNTLADQFVIAEETKSLIFYLLKEDEKTARRSETILSPDDEVKISLYVTQTPAQGYARVEICPEVRGALGNTPILLDWTTMTEIDWSREKILFELSIQGIGYPDILPQLAHRLIWERTGILDTIMKFNNCSTRERQYDSIIKQQHSSTLGRIGTRSSPFILTRRDDQYKDEHIYTAIDSDGRLPDGVNFEAVETFNLFCEKLGKDFVVSNTIVGRRNRIEQLARIGATLYLGCPEAILGYYRRVVSSTAISPKLVMYAGKVLSSEPDLTRLFKYCVRRYHEAHREGKNLSWYVVRAAGDALAYRENAGEILDPELADSLADAMLYVIKNQVDRRNFRQTPFKAAVRLSAFLLRHRMHPKHRDFLHLKSLNKRNAQRAKELLELLQKASNSGALNLELKDNIDQIQKHILYRGTNSIIDISVDDDDDAEDG